MRGNMNRVTIRTNGIPPQNVVAEWDTGTEGGAGHRTAKLSGWGQSEAQAREMLMLHARTLRNELTVAVEDMITEFCKLGLVSEDDQ